MKFFATLRITKSRGRHAIGGVRFQIINLNWLEVIQVCRIWTEKRFRLSDCEQNFIVSYEVHVAILSNSLYINYLPYVSSKMSFRCPHVI